MSQNNRRVLIVGCGYIGMCLGMELVHAGHKVWGIRRSPGAAGELQRLGIQPLIADITRPGGLADVSPEFDWVVNTVSSSKGGAEVYQKVYLDGTRRLLDWLGPRPPRKFVVTGSTSVYGQNDGSLVRETSPTEPESATARILVEAERMLLNAVSERQFPAVLLRVAGIYGPERGHLFRQFLSGEARLAGDGGRYINMIHRDDVAGAVLAALERGRPGEIYNVSDDEPVTQARFFRWLADTLGRPMPPGHPEGGASAGKRATTNKRVCNRRLRMELGYGLRYPTFREGYTAEIARLEQP